MASGAKGVKVESTGESVTVAGGVKKGRLAVAVVRPRGAAASGKVVFTVRGKAKGVKTFAAALDGGKAGATSRTSARCWSKRLKGTADMKALSPVVTAKLCGKAAPADTAGRPAAARARCPCAPAGHARRRRRRYARARRGERRAAEPDADRRRPTPAPAAPAAPCDNDRDDDGDGQTDWEDPGCAGRRRHDREQRGRRSPPRARRARGVGMGDDPTELGVGINGDCGTF